MDNPWVSEKTIQYFLGTFVTVLPRVKEIKVALGIWTGKRQFRIKLKEDPTGYERHCHPPACFTIRADWGIHYVN